MRTEGVWSRKSRRLDCKSTQKIWEPAFHSGRNTCERKGSCGPGSPGGSLTFPQHKIGSGRDICEQKGSCGPGSPVGPLAFPHSKVGSGRDISKRKRDSEPGSPGGSLAFPHSKIGSGSMRRRGFMLTEEGRPGDFLAIPRSKFVILFSVQGGDPCVDAEIFYSGSLAIQLENSKHCILCRGKVMRMGGVWTRKYWRLDCNHTQKPHL
jgi:hypothetical protein